MKLELKWGLIIGVVNFVWLVGTYYLGMHTRGIAMIQLVTLVSVVVSLFGYVVALRSLIQREPETTYLEGLKSGILVAGVVAICAVLSQLIYHTLVFPGFTDYMVEQTRLFYEAREVPQDVLETLLESARESFGMKSYLIQAGGGAFILGCLFSAVAMGFLRIMARNAR